MEQDRLGFAGASRKTADAAPHFFQRIYDLPALRNRLLDCTSELTDLCMITVWQENVLIPRMLSHFGENVRGLFGALNPLLSAAVNRSAEGARNGWHGRYGRVSDDAGLYGDVLISELKN